MQRWLCAAMTAFCVAAAAPAYAGDPLVLQLKWLPDAQFAGYFVAAAKGYYRDVGLDVTIKPGGPDINPSQVLAAGGADVAVLRQGAGVELLLERRAACISTMSYNEYWQVIDAGIKAAQLLVFRYE